MTETPADDVLDRTAETDGPDIRAPASTEAEPHAAGNAVGQDQSRDHNDGLDEADARAHRYGFARLVDWAQRAWQFFVTQTFSSLTRRIVVLNLTGLVALSIGVIFLSQFRAGLIDAPIHSFLVQGETIAGAIASSATVETDSSITLDPDKLLNLHPGESYGPN